MSPHTVTTDKIYEIFNRIGIRPRYTAGMIGTLEGGETGIYHCYLRIRGSKVDISAMLIGAPLETEGEESKAAAKLALLALNRMIYDGGQIQKKGVLEVYHAWKAYHYTNALRSLSLLEALQ